MNVSLILCQQSLGCISPIWPYPLVIPFYPLMSSPLFLFLQYHITLLCLLSVPWPPFLFIVLEKCKLQVNSTLYLLWTHPRKAEWWEKSTAMLPGLTLNSWPLVKAMPCVMPGDLILALLHWLSHSSKNKFHIFFSHQISKVHSHCHLIIFSLSD